MSAGLITDESLIAGSSMAALLLASCGERVRGLWGLFYKGTNPILRGPHPYDVITPKGPAS